MSNDRYQEINQNLKMTENQQITNEESKSLQKSPKKKKRKNHSDLGPDFVAPDGGYGWLICLAAGLSNVSLKLETKFSNFSTLCIVVKNQIKKFLRNF